ncbi:MAG: lipoyl(octanoyl) transferase LipB [Granulosicoccus sp.]|nr:lipoyl(octanoyl) transferase LipB [Granulosicoccus sp.]
MITRELGLSDYQQTWSAMREYTDNRQADDEDELWVCEHPPVYTLGQAGKREHILNTSGIPVIQTDRGGQVTYHGPGQVVIYTLINLRRAGLGVRDLVIRLENSVIDTLAEYAIMASGRRDAPGVYVDDAKIAALGLRVRRGCTYHGLALNIDVDLAPFNGINPCGFRDLAVTSTRELGINVPGKVIIAALVTQLHHQLRTAR